MKVIRFGGVEFNDWFAELERRRREEGDAARGVASEVIEGVRAGGDDYVAGLLEKFDGVSLAPGEILATDPVDGSITRDMKGAIDEAISRVEAFHLEQLPRGYTVSVDGSTLEHRVRPLRRIGAYVPGGRAVYLSTLIMCAVPARIAGVRDIAVATTPRAAATPEFGYACSRLGIREVYRSGGPAGVAAMALGTQSLQRVDKIVGPGNAYVTAAKQLLTGSVGIDMTAGPTEVVVLADDSSDPRLVASDLLAQAEHGDDSTVICVTDSDEFQALLIGELNRQLGEAPEKSAARRSLPEHGVIIRVDSMDAGVTVVNTIGPEHVSVQADTSRLDLDAIEDCGAVFIGPLAPVALGDYVAGPNHVLPTAGAARFFSPLGVYDFVKRSNRITVSDALYDKLAEKGALLARFEGLPLHATSIETRAERFRGVVR